MSQHKIEGFRLSPQQRQLWAMQQRGEALPYNAQSVMLIEGELDRAVLSAALRMVVARQEIFRTTFQCWTGMTIPLQVIGEQSLEAEGCFDLSRTEEQSLDAEVRELLAKLRETNFDFERGPLFQASLVKLSESTHLLAITLPGLCADAVTLRQLVSEIGLCYAACLRGEEPSGEQIQYADFAEWQNDLCEAEDTKKGRAYWRKLQLPSTFRHFKLPFETRVESNAAFRPQLFGWPLNHDLASRIEAIAAATATTPQSFLLACWQALLWRLNPGEEGVIGVAFDGRRQEGLTEAMGLYARYLPLRSEPENLSFSELLRRVNQQFLEIFKWQEYFILEQIEGANESADAVSFFPICFEFEERNESYAAAGVRFSSYSQRSCIARYKLKLTCAQRENAFFAELHYDANLIPDFHIERLAGQFSRLVESAAADLETPVAELEILSQAEREKLLIDFNNTKATFPPGHCIHHLFEQQAAHTPQALALVYEEQQMSYQELNARSNQLAHYLQRMGVRAETRVAICVERSADMLIGLLGILKAGGAYVPLDPALPNERLAFMLDDAQPLLLLAKESSRSNLPAESCPVLWLDADSELFAQEDTGNPSSQVAAENLAYIIYTSGSTGRPKGVAVEHRQLTNYVNAIWQRLDLPPAASFAMVSTFAADLGHTALYPTLCSGGALHLLSQERASHPEAMAEYFGRHRIDCLKIVPSHLSALLNSNEPQRLVPRRRLVLGGESSDWQLIERLHKLRDDCIIFNHYGPTEVTVGALVYQVNSENDERFTASPPLGRPLANTQVYLLDSYLRPVPLGVRGELYLGGAGVTRGYLNRPELTAGKFIPHPFTDQPGERLYKTGDVARYLPDGNIEFLGRIDRQVKLRGFRIELGEIEAVLNQHPAVREAVVTLRADANRNQSLVAYLTTKHQPLRELAGRVRYQLPNGLRIVHQNKSETDYMYREIFEEQVYLRNGIELAADACVFDVGANIGLFTLFTSGRCADGKIYAFEPVAPTFDALRLNTALYAANVKLFPVGLSEVEKAAAFTFYPRSSMMSGLSTYADAMDDIEALKRLMRNHGQAGEDGANGWLEHADEIFEEKFRGETHQCNLRRLSDLIREEGVARIDLLKVDVQRAELDVLKGIEPEDWRKIRQVVLEVHDEQGASGGGRLHQVTELLASRGFAVVIEQPALFAGTDRYNLYATRPGNERPHQQNGNQGTPTRQRSANAETVSSDELRQFMAAKLPEYMRPAAFVFLDELPLTPNGKIDYQSLPAPASARRAHEEASPLTPTAELIATIWEELLGVERVGVDEDFFELGGHSLMAAQIVSRLQNIFQVSVPLRILFESPTVAKLTQSVESLIGETNGLPVPRILTAPREGKLPLSFAQRRLWFLDQLEPNSPLYNVHLALTLKGSLNVSALEQTFNEIIRRHEGLRTTFAAADEPAQVIAPQLSLQLKITDLDALSESERDAEAQRLMTQEARSPFDLARGPLLRASLLRMTDEHHILLLTMHHIISDGWSLGVLAREVSILYPAFNAGEPPPLPELPIQYADFAAWQREWMKGETLDRHLDYWKRQLAGLSVLRLPADKSPAGRSSRGAAQSVRLSEELTRALKTLSRQEGVTLFVTLLAAFQTLLHHYSKQDDIAVGTDVANRPTAETESLIGFFVNQLVLRTDLSGNPTFRELLQRVREVFLGAYAHQDMPFDKLVEALKPDRTLSRTPLFQAKLVLQNAPLRPLRLSGLESAVLPSGDGTQTAKFDLMLTLTETAGALAGTLEYCTDLFSTARIAHLADDFIRLLDGIAARPEARLNSLNVFQELEMKPPLPEERANPTPKLMSFTSIKPKAVSLSQAKVVRTSYLESGRLLPLVIEPEMDNVDLAGWVANNRQLIETKLLQHGGLLFRGFAINTDAAFERFLASTSVPLMHYIEGATPRTQLRDKVYTSTEYPADQSIALHNELTYVSSWPMKIWFCCLQPAEQRGETPIADMRKVLLRLAPEVRARFMERGWMLVRNFSAGLSLPWQISFHTESKAEVEAYCRRSDIRFEWKENDGLRTSQVRPAIATHPQTGEEVWFNHVAFWHLSSLEPQVRDSMLAIFPEQDLAYNTYYGDGSRIEDSVVAEIREAYRQETIEFAWQRGDILMLDNMLVAHGRNPFVGERKVLVGMGEAYRRPSQLASFEKS